MVHSKAHSPQIHSMKTSLWQAATQSSHCFRQFDLKNLQKNSSYLLES